MDSHSTFGDNLRDLGYRFEPDYHDKCDHSQARSRMRVYLHESIDGHPQAEINPENEEAWTAFCFGDLPWFQYDGCKGCTEAVLDPLLCGCCYQHLRVFDVVNGQEVYIMDNSGGEPEKKDPLDDIPTPDKLIFEYERDSLNEVGCEEFYPH